MNFWYRICIMVSERRDRKRDGSIRRKPALQPILQVKLRLQRISFSMPYLRSLRSTTITKV